MANRPVTLIDIVQAKGFRLTGYADSAVRASFDGVDGGFATTSYSFSMTSEAKTYSAERLKLLLEKAQGLTNEQIKEMSLR
ncbi:hypothetical protein [Shewanella marisflavi]|uniref:hypothetical protein n=1 Tax=Shewanella marisflavi TaxID=260364 RepID=UPI003AACFBEF